MIKEQPNLIDEEIKIRKMLKVTLEARLQENNLQIKELEKQQQIEKIKRINEQLSNF